jgi:hypothetical protein
MRISLRAGQRDQRVAVIDIGGQHDIQFVTQPGEASARLHVVQDHIPGTGTAPAACQKE